jgi:hypothetical protein
VARGKEILNAALGFAACFVPCLKALAQTPTGQVVHYDQRPVLNLTHRSLFLPSATTTIATRETLPGQNSRALTLIKPETLAAPTFAEDLATAMMSEDDIRDIEQLYAQQLRDFAQRTGFFETARDSRSSRPIGWTKEYESYVRGQMAHSLKGYMIARGIPRFLKTRDETKHIAQNYEHVVNAAKVEFKTKDNWYFSTRIDPSDFLVKMRYHNSLWNFEAVSTVGLADPYVLAQHRIGLYVPEMMYYVVRGVVAPGVGCQWTPLLSTKVAASMPLHSTQVLRDTYATFVVDMRF